METDKLGVAEANAAKRSAKNATTDQRDVKSGSAEYFHCTAN